MPDLRLDVIAEADAAAAELGSVGTAARGMASDVSAASSSASNAARDMDGLAGSADNLDSKASQATGAFGALAGGLEAAGFEGAAAGLQGVAIATDFASGAGGLLNLVLQSQAVSWIRNTAATAAHSVAAGAQASVSGVATAAQWAWNAALAANPVGLVVAAVALLAIGIGVAYAKVEPFRNAVDAAMGRAADAVGFVVDAVGELGDLVGVADRGWDAIRRAAGEALQPVEDAVGGVSDALSTAVGWVQDLVEWIGRIDFPDIPGLDLPFGRVSGTGSTGQTLVQESVTLQLATEPYDREQRLAELVEALAEFYARRGQTLSIVEVPAA